MSAVVRLIQALTLHSGINHRDLAPIAVAALVAANRCPPGDDPRAAFAALQSAIQPRNEADALSRARDWLGELELDEPLWAILAARWPAASSSLDWTAELDALVNLMRFRAPFIPMSTRIGAALGDAFRLPDAGTVACLYAGSATIAWGLAASRPVTIHVTNWEVEIILALLAFADGRPLAVDRRNPIEMIPFSDGGFRFDQEHRPGVGEYDHLVAVPPFGLRIKDGEASGLLFEAWQVEQLAPRARKTFLSLATDGLLFRETRGEAEFRERLTRSGQVSVTSLPPGMFGRASGVQVSLLIVEPHPPGDVRFTDGRSMERISRSGREQEDLIVRQLARLADAPAATVGLAELATAKFNLLPSRYVVSGMLARMETMLSVRPTARLGDLAKIIRPRAPQPVRGEPSDDDVTAAEIGVSDIVEGKVASPAKEVRFPARERGGLSRVQVEQDDILVSIKGNVGVAGLVGLDADFGDMMGTPWIVSQSLAILRQRRDGHAIPARVLAAILGSPPMREKLQALAGGTTVPSLPISALQSLPVPLLRPDEAFEIEVQLDELDAMQIEIDGRIANRRILRRALWRNFWSIPAESDED